MKINDHTKNQLIRFLKFGVVGGSGLFVNMGMLWLLTDVAGIYYLFSSVLAIFLSMLNNFIWNDIWTWRDRRKPGARAFFIRMFKFCIVSSFASYVGNLSVLWILTHFFNFYYLIANLFGISIGTTLNFSLNHIWTFKV